MTQAVKYPISTMILSLSINVSDPQISQIFPLSLLEAQQCMPACRVSKHSQHTQSACTVSIHTQRAQSACTVSIHSQHAQSAYTLSVHRQHAKSASTVSKYRSQSQHAQSARTEFASADRIRSVLISMHSIMREATFHSYRQLHNVLDSPDQGHCQEAPVRGGKQLLRNCPVSDITSCPCAPRGLRFTI